MFLDIFPSDIPSPLCAASSRHFVPTVVEHLPYHAVTWGETALCLSIFKNPMGGARLLPRGTSHFACMRSRFLVFTVFITKKSWTLPSFVWFRLAFSLFTVCKTWKESNIQGMDLCPLFAHSLTWEGIRTTHPPTATAALRTSATFASRAVHANRTVTKLLILQGHTRKVISPDMKSHVRS